MLEKIGECVATKTYMWELFIHFMVANGIKLNDLSIDTKLEFKSWLALMNSIKDKYADLVCSMYIDKEKVIAELGKGYYDSIVPNLQSRNLDAVALTIYANTFKNEVKAYNGKIHNIENPYILYTSKDKQNKLPNCNPLFNTNIGTIIVQLPIDGISMAQIKALIESSRRYNDIIIGSYGIISDKNLKANIKKLREIKERIENLNYMSCKEEFVEDNGTYQHLIMSHQKRLNKELIFAIK